jgi:ribosomal protein S27E
MARPSKNQIRESKAQLAFERRNVKLELAHRRAPFMACQDFAYVECEKCGQEQLDGLEKCIVCGHEIARTSPLNDEVQREYATLRDAVMCDAA